MRGTAVVSLVYLGCYNADPRAGVPCDPVTRACPIGQQCVDTAGGPICDPTLGGGDDASIDSMSDIDAAMIDSAPMTDALTQVTVVAVVADCVDPLVPNPDTCITQNGAGQMVIDANDSTTMDPWNAYVRFDLDGTISGRTVTGVTLRMMATTDAKADSPSSGSVQEVAPFTRATLFMTAPAPVGAVLAGSQGAVAANDVVNWTLPASLVAPNASVYLGITTASNDGVNYWNSSGTTPPRLVIDLQ